MLLISSFIPLLSLLSCALGAPLLERSSETDPLVKRSSETNYLVNCYNAAELFYTSEMAYYSNGANSQNGQYPNDICQVDLIGYEKWEGHPVGCTYSDSGVTFTSNIYTFAQSEPNYSLAGTGSNNYHSFNCYKDSGRLLYNSDYTNCYSIYYCLDA
ncbi:hypothetical protein MMC11_000900 [Xylographa trunciseda]|nr:hypothetical protein [Xylographa trunciseda]